MLAVSLPDRLMRGLRQRACRAFPKEYFCLVLGRRYGESLEILDLWHPPMPELLENAEPGSVTQKKEWVTQAMEAAARKRAIVIGNIHTHTFRKGEREIEPIQSIGDLQGWTDLDLIAGVMNVVERRNGRKHCSSLVFYGPTEPVAVSLK